MTEVRSRLVIIGNGFDLAHGFKTSYTDFIIWYLNDCMQKTYKQFNYRDTLLETSRPNMIRTFQKVTVIKDFQEISAKNDIKIIQISRFFEKLINSHNEYNWVDIENEYYQLVVSIYNRLIDVNNYNKRHSFILEIKKLNEEFEFLRYKLEEYLIFVQKDFIEQSIPNPDGKFNKLFQKYFDKIEESRTIITGNKIKNVFLNFNYTNTVEKLLKYPSHNYELIYIHGKLNESKNPVIFGFGDETDEYYEKIENLKINDF